MIVEFDEDAERELYRASDFYESRRRGYGRKFIWAVEQTAARCINSPHAGARWPGTPREPAVRRRRVPGFPAEDLAYVALPDRIYVLPYSPGMLMNLAERLFSAGRHQEALEQLDRVRDMVPLFAAGSLREARYLSLLDRHEKAIARLRDVPESDSGTQFLSTAAMVYARAGRLEPAREYKSRLVRLFESQRLSATRIAHACVALDEPDEAMQWLERAFEERELALLYAGIDSLLAALNERADFAALLSRVGVPRLL